MRRSGVRFPTAAQQMCPRTLSEDARGVWSPGGRRLGLLPTLLGMGSVPAWVWPNAGMLVAVGVYLWWRLVVGTTRPHSAAAGVGTVAAGSHRPARPGRVDRPIRAADQRRNGSSAGRAGSGTRWSSSWPPPPCSPSRSGSSVVVAPAAGATSGGRSRSQAIKGPVAGVAGAPPVPAAGAGVGIVGAAAVTTGIAAAVGGGRPGRPDRNLAVPGLPVQAVGMRIALVSDLHLGSVLGPGLLPLGRRTGQRPAARPGPVGRRPDRRDGRRAGRGPAPAGRSAVAGGHVRGHRQSRVYFDPGRLAGAHPALGIRVLTTRAYRCAGLLLAGITTSRGGPAGVAPTWTRPWRPGRRAAGDHAEPLTRTWSRTPPTGRAT